MPARFELFKTVRQVVLAAYPGARRRTVDQAVAAFGEYACPTHPRRVIRRPTRGAARRLRVTKPEDLLVDPETGALYAADDFDVRLQSFGVQLRIHKVPDLVEGLTRLWRECVDAAGAECSAGRVGRKRPFDTDAPRTSAGDPFEAATQTHGRALGSACAAPVTRLASSDATTEIVRRLGGAEDMALSLAQVAQKRRNLSGRGPSSVSTSGPAGGGAGTSKATAARPDTKPASEPAHVDRVCVDNAAGKPSRTSAKPTRKMLVKFKKIVMVAYELSESAAQNDAKIWKWTTYDKSDTYGEIHPKSFSEVLHDLGYELVAGLFDTRSSELPFCKFV